MSPLPSIVAAARLPRAGLTGPSASRKLLPLAALAGGGWLTNAAYAIDVVTIEEHWELSVGLPDDGSSSPQVTMVTSPTGDLEDDYFVFTLNHHSVPSWVPGGMQVQQWRGESLVDSKTGPQQDALHHSDEVITWVQRTSLNGGQLAFEIVNGNSDSWGNFGGQGFLRLAVASPLSNLNGYRPAVSLDESGVSFGGNRVAGLVLKKLRWIDSAGNAYELNAPIDVDADLDP
ncbi:MAG: hypothetical protein IT424_02860 [Pirellulales bacterium]|nr:hypothetical protein [Pirellulales bacterium]